MSLSAVTSCENTRDLQSSNSLKWPHVSSFFQQIFDTATNTPNNSLTFKCLLCVLRRKLISVSHTSNANLRGHIKVIIIFFILYSLILYLI